MNILKNEKNLSDFTKKCLLNESIYDYGGSIKIIKKYYTESENLDEFIDKVLNDERLENNQGYWELLLEKRPKLYKNKILEILNKYSSENFITISDAGSIKIGNSSFQYMIKNGYGDGKNNIFIINQNIHIEGLKFETIIKGEKINIYKNDCSDEAIYTLSGEYSILTGREENNSLFVFIKNNK